MLQFNFNNLFNFFSIEALLPIIKIDFLYSLVMSNIFVEGLNYFTSSNLIGLVLTLFIFLINA